MTEKKLVAWGKGPLKIYDIELDCYVLEDGSAILNKGKMMKAIGRQWKGASRTNMPNFIGAMNLQPFVRDELKEKIAGVDFYDGGRLVSGYPADLLPLVCDVYLEARQAGALTASQLPIAQRCEILVRSFARVGITALIYEALGFEKFKNPEAYRMLVESYMAEDLRKWMKEFPDEFFWQLDRIYGNQRTTSKNRPQYYAKFINKYIYSPLENGLVLKELANKNPITEKGYRKHKLFQYLNEEKGILAMRAQLWQTIGILKTSSNKRLFESNYRRMTGQDYQADLFE